MPRSRLPGLLVAILCLLLLWWLLCPSAAPPGVVKQRPAAISAEEEKSALEPPVLREQFLPPQVLLDGPVRFRILEQGELFPITGMLQTDSMEQGFAAHEVWNGAGVLPLAVASYLRRHANQPVIPASVSWQAGVAAITSVDSDSPDGVLNLTIAPAVELRLRVIDLAGDPISGAMVVPILDLATIDPRSERLTGSDGIAVLRLSARHGRIQFRVGKEGYAPHQQCVDAATQGVEEEVRLRRILGYAIAIDRRWRATMTCNFGIGVRTGVGFAIPATIRRSLHDRLKGAALFDPAEEETYVQLFSETAWVTQSSGQAGLIVDGQMVAAMEVPVLPISDPAFAVHRFPEEQTRNLLRHPWILLRLLPDEAFLADPPEELRIRLGVLEGRPDEPGDPSFTYAEFRRVADRQYRAALPAGKYELLGEGRDWVMSAESLGDAEEPGFAPGQTFHVNAAATLQEITAHLAPGERWIQYTICDPHGRNLDLRALLFPHREAPHVAESHFGLQLGAWPHGRFIRPGNYDLLVAVRNPQRMRRLSSALAWPPDVPPSLGLVRVILPMQDSDFDPFTFH